MFGEARYMVIWGFSGRSQINVADGAWVMHVLVS